MLTEQHRLQVREYRSRNLFTTAEATDIAVKAGLKNPTMQHHWPQRFLLSWRPDAGEFRA